jgi:hypothetical protein
MGEFETVVAIGDSVVWGQALQHEDKFVTQVYEELTGERFPERNLKAHSGAIIGADGPVRGVEQEYGPIGTRTGRHEKPSDGPTILQQLDRLPYDYLAHDGFGSDLQREDDRAYDRAADVDLVFLDGGINDVGISAITDVFESREDFAEVIEQHCYVDLSTLLKRTRRKFPNATIVVTSYFPFVSHESDLKLKELVALGALVVGLILSPLAGIAAFLFGSSKRRRLLEGVLFFNRHQLAGVRRAVAEQRRVDDGPGIVFATPRFRPKNSANAPEAWLWPVREGTIPTGGIGNPEIAELRHAVCDATDSGIACKKAATCHPNPDGADAYTAAILEGLEEHRERTVREPVSRLRGGRSADEFSVRDQLERHGLDTGHGLRTELDHATVDSLTIEFESQLTGVGSVLLLEVAGELVPLDTHVPTHVGGVRGPRRVDRYHVDPIVALDRPPEAPLRLWELDDLAVRREPLGPWVHAPFSADAADDDGRIQVEPLATDDALQELATLVDDQTLAELAVHDDALVLEDTEALKDSSDADALALGQVGLDRSHPFPGVWDVGRVSLSINGIHVYEDRDHRLVGDDELALEYPYTSVDARPERARAAP